MISHTGSSTGAHQWCSHLVNAFEVASATALLPPFQPLLVAMLTSGFDFQHKVSY